MSNKYISGTQINKHYRDKEPINHTKYLKYDTSNFDPFQCHLKKEYFNFSNK